MRICIAGIDRMIMYRKYADYDTTDFATDEAFKRWVKHRADDEELNVYWETFRRRYPGKALLMREAENIILGLSRPNVYSPGDASRVWAAIQPHTQVTTTPESTTISAWRRRLPMAYRYAAVITLLLGAFVVLWLGSQPHMEEWTTAYGEHKTIELPDHSIVKLGAHSRLRYRHNWDNTQVREIWMQGEGRFTVKHINQDTTRVKDHHRFIVHVEDQLDIEVLGTVFTVRNRRGQTQVALESGAIQVNMDQLSQRLTQAGESVQAIPARAVLAPVENTPTISADDMLTLTNTSVREIFQLVEDNYGLTLRAEDPALLNRTVDGALPLNDQEDVLAALASILQVEIIRQDDVLVFRP